MNYYCRIPRTTHKYFILSTEKFLNIFTIFFLSWFRYPLCFYKFKIKKNPKLWNIIIFFITQIILWAHKKVEWNKINVGVGKEVEDDPFLVGSSRFHKCIVWLVWIPFPMTLASQLCICKVSSLGLLHLNTYISKFISLD